MSQAAIFDTPALKWPFAARPAGVSRPVIPSVRPAVTPAAPESVVTVPAAAPANTATSANVAAPPMAFGTTVNASASLGGVGTAATFVTRRQMVGDVLLVAMWGAIIPGVLWLGHAAGF